MDNRGNSSTISTTAHECARGCGTWLDENDRDANGTKHKCRQCPYIDGRLLWEFQSFRPPCVIPMVGAIWWIQRGDWRVRTTVVSINLVAAGKFGNEAKRNYAVQVKVTTDAEHPHRFWPAVRAL